MSNKPILQELSPGDTIGPYEILRLIYKGGQAYVYLARLYQQTAPPAAQVLALLDRCDLTGEQIAAAIRAEQICAIKIPNPGWDDHVCDEHAFLKADESGHPHLIRLFSPDASSAGGRPRPELGMALFADTNGQKHRLHYLALAYLPGGSLKDLLRKTNHRPLPAPAAVAIAAQIADAIEHLHTHLRLVHHDISPSNIIFKQQLSGREPRRPHCVLIDLAVADRPENPQLANPFGKQIYLPPERLNGQVNEGLSYAIDIYSLGVVLFEMLYGSIPASTDSVRRQSFQFIPVREHLPHLSEPLGDLLDLMLSRDPARRPPIAELRRHLAATPEAQQPAELLGPLTACDQQAIAQLRRRRNIIVGGGSVIALLAGALAATLALGNPGPPEPPREATVTPIATPAPVITPAPTLAPTATIAPAAPRP